MTPLIFTGLAVAISFRAGLWNIGAEGQMLWARSAAGIVGYASPMPDISACSRLHPGGFDRRRRLGGHSCVAARVSRRQRTRHLPDAESDRAAADRLFSARVLKAPGPTNKLPDVLNAARLTNFTLYSQLNTGMFIALACCVLFAVFNVATMRGFEWKLIGLNRALPITAGSHAAPMSICVMLVSGAIAGLAGAEQVLGVYGAFYDNFSPGYGFDGIAVAMLANSNPIGVILRPSCSARSTAVPRCCRCSPASPNISSRCFNSWSF